MKILIFAQHPKGSDGGGIHKYCQRLECLFVDDPTISVIYSKLLPINCKSLLGYKFNENELQKELDFQNPDIIHINGYTTRVVKQLTKAALKRRIKIDYFSSK